MSTSPTDYGSLIRSQSSPNIIPIKEDELSRVKSQSDSKAKSAANLHLPNFKSVDWSAQGKAIDITLKEIKRKESGITSLVSMHAVETNELINNVFKGIKNNDNLDISMDVYNTKIMNEVDKLSEILKDIGDKNNWNKQIKKLDKILENLKKEFKRIKEDNVKESKRKAIDNIKNIISQTKQIIEFIAKVQTNIENLTEIKNCKGDLYTLIEKYKFKMELTNIGKENLKDDIIKEIKKSNLLPNNILTNYSNYDQIELLRGNLTELYEIESSIEEERLRQIAERKVKLEKNKDKLNRSDSKLIEKSIANAKKQGVLVEEFKLRTVDQIQTIVEDEINQLIKDAIKP